MNKCICGLIPELTHVIDFSCTNWKVACKCGRETEIFKYEKNAIWNWNNLNPNNEDELKKKIDSKVHAQNLLNTDFGESADELLGNYIITDKGEMALKDKEIEELREEVKYWTNAYNEQVQGREKDMMSLEAISRLLGVTK